MAAAKKRKLEECGPLNNDCRLSTEIIKLNVGGKRMETLKSTLMQSGYFRSLLSGNYADSRQDDASYFIDRDSKMFEYLLNFMRCGYVSVPTEYLAIVKREALFYQIEMDLSSVLETTKPRVLRIICSWESNVPGITVNDENLIDCYDKIGISKSEAEEALRDQVFNSDRWQWGYLIGSLVKADYQVEDHKSGGTDGKGFPLDNGQERAHEMYVMKRKTPQNVIITRM